MAIENNAERPYTEVVGIRRNMLKMVSTVCMSVARKALVLVALATGWAVSGQASYSSGSKAINAHRASVRGVERSESLSSSLLASAGSLVEPEDELIDRVKAQEITGVSSEERRARKFLELVVFPLSVCLALVMLLRRGFLE